MNIPSLRERLRFQLNSNRVFPYLMVLPAVLAILMVTVYPIVRGVILSFYDYTLLFPRKPYIGLENYEELFTDPRFWHVLRNTVLFAAVSNLASSVIGMITALMLNRRGRYVGIFRSISLIPWITPSVVVAYIWVWMYSKSFSPINDVLLRLNLIREPLGFLGDMSAGLGPLTLPIISVLIVRIWTSFPFKTIMFLAALQRIPPELYESASIDGATRWQQFRYVTFPSVLNVVVVVLTLSMIWNMSHFDYNYLMTKGGPFDSTNVIGVFIYQTGFATFRLGYAAAVGTTMLFVSGLLALLYLWVIRRSREEL